MHKTLTTSFGVWIAVLLTGLALLIAPQPAHAHDVLVDSEPAVGSDVETTPAEVRLQFSGQPLSGQGLTNLIRVTDEDGNQWQDGDVAVEGFDLAVPLCEGLPQGEYTVAYRVIYSDGHTGEERFSFTNADPDAPQDGAPADCGEAVEQDATVEPTEPSNDTQDTLNAEEQADEQNTSSSFPTWIWIVGGIGVIVVAGIVILLMRGSRPTNDSEDAGDD